MLIDRSHRRWAALSAGMLAIAAAAYAVSARRAPQGPSGGSRMGLVFGIAAAALMLFAFLIALRRRVPAWRLGSGQFWLRGHLWMGSLAVPIVLFHTGFRFGGALENLLMVLLGVVAASGLFGLIMQQFVPRRMLQSVPLETFHEQVPFITQRNLVLCDQAVAAVCGPLDLEADPLVAAATRLTAWSSAASREEKENWLNALEPQWHPLMRSLARYAKNEGWKGMRQESDFPKALDAIYVLRSGANGRRSGPVPGAAPPAAPWPQSTSSEHAKPTGAAGLAAGVGPLPPDKAPAADAQSSAVPPAGGQGAPEAGTAKKPALSKVEQMRAAAKAAAEPAAMAPPGAGVVRANVPAAAAGSQTPVPAAAPKPPVAARKPAPAAASAEKAAASQPPPRVAELKQFYVNRVRPFLHGAVPLQELLTDEGAFRLFNVQRAELPDELHDLLAVIEKYCTERRQLLLLLRLRRWLHAWLAVHIPASVAMMVLLAWHVLLALRVVPI